MADKTARYYKYEIDGFKIESGILNTDKPRAFYISIPMWVNVGDGDFEFIIKELEKKIKWKFKQDLNDYFPGCGINRSLIILDAPESEFNRLKDKNTYICIEITLFTSVDIDFDTKYTKGINDLIFTYSTDALKFIKDVDGLCFSTKKSNVVVR